MKLHETLRSRFAVTALALSCAAASAPVASAITLGLEFQTDYTATSLGSISGVPSNYGGLTFLGADHNTLLIGGSANSANAGIYSVGLTRDIDGHITGFAGSATFFADAPNIDGGLSYGPGGVLFFTGYSNNILGQIKPGSTSPDKIINLSTEGVAASVGGLTFVPGSHPGAGQLKVVSYSSGNWYSLGLTPDGNGTYDVTSTSGAIYIGGGPEGIAYVPLGSAEFSNPSVLISEYGAGKVATYEVDANGDPDVSTRRDFLTGLSGAEGAFIDPVTGDFLFSTFGGGNQVVLVKGFAAPPSPVPDSASTLALLFGGLVAVVSVRSRRRRS